MKTISKWIADKATGSYYRFNDGEVEQSPMNLDGSRDEAIGTVEDRKIANYIKELKAHCTKCGDIIKSDEDSLCGNCI